jgi:hypothetical protein
LEYRRSIPRVLVVQFDPTGEQIPLQIAGLEELVRLADGVQDIRAVKHEGDLNAAAMRKVVDCLYDLSSRPADGDSVPFEFACYATSDAYEAVTASKMHILAGLSPDGSRLFLVFAPFSIRRCIAQVNCVASD